MLARLLKQQRRSGLSAPASSSSLRPQQRVGAQRRRTAPPPDWPAGGQIVADDEHRRRDGIEQRHADRAARARRIRPGYAGGGKSACRPCVPRPSGRQPLEQRRVEARGWPRSTAAGSSMRLTAARNSPEPAGPCCTSRDACGRCACPSMRRSARSMSSIVLQQRGELRRQRRIGQPLAGPQEMHDLAQEPGPAIGAAADHHAVGAGFAERAVTTSVERR